MANVLVDKDQLEKLMTLCEEQQARLEEFDKTEIIEISIPGLNIEEEEVEETSVNLGNIDLS